MRYCFARSLHSSTSILQNSTSFCSFASFLKIGAIFLHGPHHFAKKSVTTSRPVSRSFLRSFSVQIGCTWPGKVSHPRHLLKAISNSCRDFGINGNLGPPPLAPNGYELCCCGFRWHLHFPIIATKTKAAYKATSCGAMWQQRLQTPQSLMYYPNSKNCRQQNNNLYHHSSENIIVTCSVRSYRRYCKVPCLYPAKVLMMMLVYLNYPLRDKIK